MHMAFTDTIVIIYIANVIEQSKIHILLPRDMRDPVNLTSSLICQKESQNKIEVAYYPE